MLLPVTREISVAEVPATDEPPNMAVVRWMRLGPGLVWHGGDGVAVRRWIMDSWLIGSAMTTSGRRAIATGNRAVYVRDAHILLDRVNCGLCASTRQAANAVS